MIPASVRWIDYVALGHLHRPQQIDGDRIRYSGSPIHLSYSEVGPEKSVTIVDLSVDGKVAIDTPLIPQLHRVRKVSGTLEELLNDDCFDEARTNPA
ncbi:MAG: hypothetical protein IPK93_03640 [Solirubrobacterales bacterium]|nr:hypothetical protein [Solirubrobacterales bacterium]